MAQQRLCQFGPVVHRRGQEGFGLRGGGRQHRLQGGDQHAEQVQALAAHGLQLRVGAFLLGDDPRLDVVDVAVGFVGQGHGQADRRGRVVALVGFTDRRQAVDEALVLRRIGQLRGQLAVEALADEAGAAAGQVDELADQVGVDAGDEVTQVQVEIVDATAGLGGVVVAQRFRLQAGIEEGTRHHEGAARLAHLGAVHGQVAVDVQAGRRAVAGTVQHRRPEQAVEVDDVLADEVVQLGGGTGAQMRFEVLADPAAQSLEAGQVADRRVQPDVEVLARLAGNLETEVRCIARDVPRAQATFGIEPLTELGLHARQGDVAGQPFAQERVEVAHLEEEVLRIAHFRRGTGDDRTRFLQIGRRIGSATHFAVVAVLVGAAAVRADALDVAVGQEHALGRVVELRHRTAADVAGRFQLQVELLGQRLVGRRIGRVVVVEGHAEGGEVTFVAGLDVGDESFRGDPGLFRGQHDRRAVGVVGADEPGLAAAHSPRTHPDVGLDVADQVAQVQRAVGVGQGGGDERGTGHGRGVKPRGTAEYRMPATR